MRDDHSTYRVPFSCLIGQDHLYRLFDDTRILIRSRTVSVVVKGSECGSDEQSQQGSNVKCTHDCAGRHARMIDAKFNLKDATYEDEFMLSAQDEMELLELEV